MSTGIKSGCTRRVNGLYIQAIDNLHKVIKVLFAYSQEKITASQEDIATPEIPRSWEDLEEMAHRIHNQPDVEIGLVTGINIPSAFQRHLLQRKRVLGLAGYPRLDSHWP